MDMCSVFNVQYSSIVLQNLQIITSELSVFLSIKSLNLNQIVILWPWALGRLDERERPLRIIRSQLRLKDIQVDLR